MMNIFRSHKLNSFTCFLMGALFLTPSAGAGEFSDVEELMAKFPIIYRFTDHLSEAETLLVSEEKMSETGVWKDGRFSFPGHGKNAEIIPVTILVEKQKKRGILLYFYPNQKTSRRIRFRNVPAGQQLSLYYGMTASSKAAQASKTAAKQSSQTGGGDTTPFVSLRVWIGRHEIKRIQVGAEKGWKKTNLDLGIASFLKRKLTMTFELTADSTKPRRIVFGGEILK